MLSILRGLDRLLIGAAVAVAVTLLALMACVTFYQVITRFLLEEPSKWSEVASRSMMIWMVYLGLAVVLRTGSLISIDMLLNAVSHRLRKLLAVVIAAMSLSVLGVMFWYGWAMTVRTSSQALAGLVDPITGASIPIGLVYAAIPIGAAISIVAVIARLLEDLAGRRRPDGSLVHEI